MCIESKSIIHCTYNTQRTDLSETHDKFEMKFPNVLHKISVEYSQSESFYKNVQSGNYYRLIAKDVLLLSNHDSMLVVYEEWKKNVWQCSTVDFLSKFKLVKPFFVQ